MNMKFSTGILLGMALIQVARAQAYADGNVVQAQLNAAVSSGMPFFVLPNTTITLKSSLTIPSTARDFTLIGGDNTKLIRSSAADFPLLLIGNLNTFAFSNTPFAAFQKFNIQPAAEGASTLQLSSATTCPPGTYAIVGAHPTNDIVRHSNGITTFQFKRELIKVTGQSGTTLTLAEPIGRAFDTPELYLLEADSAPSSQWQIATRIRVINVAMDGRLGDITDGRAAISKLNRVSKAFVVGLAQDINIDNVRVKGFSNSGINVMMSKRVTIQNATISEGNTKELGYGIEYAATRFTWTYNSTMQDLQSGIIFQSGAMDAYVSNCAIPPGRGSFDVSHGCGEKRITYENCTADKFKFGNSSYRRGGKDLKIINCSAFKDLVINSNAEDVLIRGYHPSEPITAQRILIFTNQDGSGLPTGPIGPISLRTEQAIISNYELPGKTLEFINDVATTPSKLGSGTFVNTIFQNKLLTGNGVIEVGGITNPCSLTFQSCGFNNYNPSIPPVKFWGVGSGGAWNASFTSCTFTGQAPHALRTESGANGTYNFTGNTYNGSPVTATNTSNGGAPGSTFVFH